MICALLPHQLLVRPLLYDTPLGQQYDPVAEPGGGKPVRDEEHAFPPQQGLILLVDLRLRQRIQRRCGLIEHDERRIAVKRPRQQKFLLLPAGKPYAVRHDVLAQMSIELSCQASDLLVKPCLREHLPHFLAVVRLRQRDIFTDTVGSLKRLLKDSRLLGKIAFPVQIPRADTVDIHGARCREIQPCHQLHDRRLACAVHTDKGDLLARRQAEADIAQRLRLRAAVAVADMIELDLDVRPRAAVHRLAGRLFLL